MAEFTSWDSYGQFSREVVSHRRYVRTPESEEFLRTVAVTCKARLRRVKKDSIFWRAQLGHDLRVGETADYRQLEEVAFPPPRMRPREKRATEGRANPKGIPCLYVSTTAHAAMSEVRPWVGALVSLAQFKVVRPLTIVDCSVLHDQYLNLAFLNRTFDMKTSTMSTLSSDEVEKIVWCRRGVGWN
jgi:RES domain